MKLPRPVRPGADDDAVGNSHAFSYSDTVCDGHAIRHSDAFGNSHALGHSDTFRDGHGDASPTSTPSPTATSTPTATPSVSPTATPAASTTPLPTPNLSATPAPSPVSTLNSPPPVNAAITLDSSKTIETNAPKVKGGGNFNGSFYEGPAVDGPASWFVFGNSSTHDAQHLFDARFGTNYDQALPAGGIAVIRFDSITFQAAPTLQLNGPIDVALVGDNGIFNSSTLMMDLSPLGSFTLATTNGTISLDSATFTATGSTLKFLHFYQRGTMGMTFNGVVNIPSASFYVDSGGSLTLGGTSSLTADRIAMNSTGSLTLNGAIDTNFLQLTSQSDIQLTKKLTVPPILYAYAPYFSTTQTLDVLGGDLGIGTGGISAGTLDLTGFDNITTGGYLVAKNVSVKNQLSVGGTYYPGISASSIAAFGIEILGGIYGVGFSGGIGGNLTLQAASLLVDSGPGAINGINLNGGDSFFGIGGSGGTLNIGTTATPIPGNVTVNVPITATTGSNFFSTGGNGGTVNVTSGGTVAVNSTIKVSESASPRASRTGGTINVTSNKTIGTAISISSSGQLLALLNSVAPGPGGTIKLTSAGGDVNVNGTVKADRGTVEMTNTGATGVVNVNNATLHGDVVKVGALGNNGTLNVGGGSIDAASTIKLYAGGSNGQVNFTDNVTLSGNSLKIIAADTVTIFNGKVVTVLGTITGQCFHQPPELHRVRRQRHHHRHLRRQRRHHPVARRGPRILMLHDHISDETTSERGIPAAASELNNLLQIVSGTVSMLENVWEGAPGSEKYFEMLLVSVERAAKVTAQLVQQVGGADDKILLHPALVAEFKTKPVTKRAPVSRCILIVDDEPMALILGQRILAQAGYTVVVAQSGFDALDLFRANPLKFDLVLLDLTMPFMDGEETFKRLRSIDPAGGSAP